MRIVQAGVMVLGAVMYIAVIVFADWLRDDLNRLLVIVAAWNLVLLIVTVVVIVDAIRKIRAKRTQHLAADALVVKLAAIPFFVLNCFVLAVFAIMGMAVLLFGGPVLWVVAGVGIGLTYPAMLSTSVYAWAAIAQLRRDRTITTWQAVLYAVLSLVYVADTAVGVLLFGHARRRPLLALVIVLWSFGSSLIGAGVAFDLGVAAGIGAILNQSGLITTVGIAVLVAAVAVTLPLLPALRREARHAAPADEGSAERAGPDRVLES